MIQEQINMLGPRTVFRQMFFFSMFDAPAYSDFEKEALIQGNGQPLLQVERE
jgi:hypothetical protein